MEYKSIYSFKCGICGKQEESTDHKITDKWGFFQTGKNRYLDMFRDKRNFEFDVCPECTESIFKVSQLKEDENIKNGLNWIQKLLRII
jgi:hypothetical protein